MHPRVRCGEGNESDRLKVLLDHDVPAQLRLLLHGNLVLTARAMGWDLLMNGELLAAAHLSGFDVLVTGDQNLSYQQDNLQRLISPVVITDTRLRRVIPHAELVREALLRSTPGSFETVVIPQESRPARAVE